jgi:hypothetical protein
VIGIGCSVMNEKCEEVESFVGFMKVPYNKTWEQRCIDEFWSKQKETLDYIKERWEEPKTVMNAFKDWLNMIDLKYKDDLVVLSDNGGYDYAWIDTYLSEFTNRNSIYYKLVLKNTQSDDGIILNTEVYSFRRTWCTNSMYHGVLLERTGVYEEWSLEKKVGCQNEVWKNDHNPLNDARNIACNYILFYNKNIKKE